MTTTLAPSLTSLDRCDRCGAQAYVRATLGTGGELLFCGHHAKEFVPTLEARGDVTILDETSRLTDEA